MERDREVIFGQDKFIGFSPVCGLPLMPDGACKKYHRNKRAKIGKYSGKSKTPYGKYEDR